MKILSGVAVAAVLLALGLLIGGQVGLSEDGWGALGQWFGGGASTAAVVAALTIARRDWQSAHLAAASARRAHAFLVVSACTEKKIVVTNHGPEPITQLVVPRIYAPDGGITANPAEFPPEYRPMLLPGDTWTVDYPASGHRSVSDLRVRLLAIMEDNPAAVLDAEIHWTDLHGTHWKRRGQLEPLTTRTSDWSAPNLLDRIEQDGKATN